MRSRLFLAALAVILFGSAAARAQAPSTGTLPTSRTMAAAQAQPTSLTAQLLLSNPLAQRPEYQYLIEQRNKLARQDGKLEAFEKVGDDFEKRGAIYSALEILWFAEKIAQKPEERKALETKLQALSAKSKEQGAAVDVTQQVWDSGKLADAMNQLVEVLKKDPYNEKANYQFAFYYYQRYMKEEAQDDALLEPALRASIFRICYQYYHYTLAIDPLYADAWYQLNVIRTILADFKDFVLNSQDDLTQRGLDFRAEVLPAMSKLDDGDRSPKALMDAANGFEKVGLIPYAIYACQAVLAQSGVDKQSANDARAKIDTLLKKLP